jgi:hypothetical protein
MKEKAILFGEAIWSSTMWRGESGMAYNAFYMPSLGYGTPAMTLSKKDSEEIQRPVVNVILPKMGIARTVPRAVVFGTAQYGGLGLTHLFVYSTYWAIYVAATLQGASCKCYWNIHNLNVGVHKTTIINQLFS